MTEHYERALEPTPQSLGLPPGKWFVSPEDRTRYIRWVQALGELPIDVRFGLLVWILRSVVAPREHYGKDADTKLDETLPIIEWIVDRTGLNIEALVHDLDPPNLEALQMLKAPVTPIPVEDIRE